MNEEMLLQLKKIAERLKKEYGAEEVILFGSHAEGKATEHSDTDILIIAPTNERFFERMATVLKLTRDLYKGLALSPIILRPEELKRSLEKGDQFIQEILDKGVKIMNSPQDSLIPEDWKKVAKKDWERIRRQLAHEDAEAAGYFLQQALEKYLKAFLLQHGWKLKKIHQLHELLNDAVVYNPELEQFRKLCERVSGYYFAERYPPLIPFELTGEDIEKDMKEAEEFIRAMFGENL